MATPSPGPRPRNPQTAPDSGAVFFVPGGRFRGRAAVVSGERSALCRRVLTSRRTLLAFFVLPQVVPGGWLSPAGRGRRAGTPLRGYPSHFATLVGPFRSRGHGRPRRPTAPASPAPWPAGLFPVPCVPSVGPIWGRSNLRAGTFPGGSASEGTVVAFWWGRS